MARVREVERRLSAWEDGACTAERACELVTTTPPEWAELARLHAVLAASLAAGSAA